MRVADDADDDAVEDCSRPDHADVPEGHRVESVPGLIATMGFVVGHFANTVSRAEPYRRVVTRSRGSAGSVRASVSTTTRPDSATTAEQAELGLELLPAPVRRVEQDELVAVSSSPFAAEDGDGILLQDERTREPERLEIPLDHSGRLRRRSRRRRSGVRLARAPRARGRRPGRTGRSRTRRRRGRPG